MVKQIQRQEQKLPMNTQTVMKQMTSNINIPIHLSARKGRPVCAVEEVISMVAIIWYPDGNTPMYFS